jgi:hypothetical protein
MTRDTHREISLLARWLRHVGRRVTPFLRWLTTAGLPYLIILGVSVYVALVNVGGNYVLRFIDIAWPVQPDQQLAGLTYAWSSSNLGNVNVLNFFNAPGILWTSGLHFLGFSLAVQEIVSLTAWQFMAGAYFYRLFKVYLLKDFPGNITAGLSLAAALAGTINYAVQGGAWWDGIPNGFVMLAFGAPMLFYLTEAFEHTIRTGRTKWTSVALAIGFGSIALSVNIPSNLSLAFLGLTVPLFILRYRPSLPSRAIVSRIGRYFLTVYPALLVTSLWWIYPSILQTQLSPGYLGSLEGLSGGTLLFQQSTAGLTMLKVFSGFYGYGYASYAYNPTVNLMYWIGGGAASFFILVVPTAVVLARPRRSFWGAQYALSLLLVIALVVTGVNSPIYSAILSPAANNALFLALLRTPYVTFGYAFFFVLIISFIEAASLILPWLLKNQEVTIPVSSLPPNNFGRPQARLWRRSKSHMALSTPFFVAFLLVFTPFALTSPAPLLGDALPGSPYQSHAQIPTFEYDTANYIEGNYDGQYVLLFPGGFIEQNWSYGYDGYDILPNLLTGLPVIDNYETGFLAGSNGLLTLVYTTLQAGNFSGYNLSGLMELLGIKYLVVEGDVGGGFPFASTTEPDYPKLLSALNSSAGISLTARFGPNWVYQIENPNPLVTSAKAVIPSDSLGPNDTLSGINITSLYYNTTLVSSPFAPAQNLFPLWDGGIVLNLTPEIKSRYSSNPVGPPLGGSFPPTMFNGVPIRIDSSQWKCLTISFETNQYTAVDVSLLTAPSLTALNSTDFEANDVSVGRTGNSLGLGDPQLFDSYGAGYYTSPGHWTNMTLDLQQILPPTGSGEIYYILISLFPVDANGSGLRGVPIVSWPGYQEVTVGSIILGNSYYLRPASTSRVPVVSLSGSTPTSNLTTEYYYGTLTNSSTAPPHNIAPTLRSGTILFSLNNSTRDYINTHPLAPPLGPSSGPTIFNAIPLDANVSEYPYLSVNFSTNRNAAVTFSVVTIANLSSVNDSTFLSNDSPILGPNVNLGDGDPQLTPVYGAGYHVTNGSFVTLIANLGGIIRPSQNDTVDFLLVGVAPVADNGSGLPGIPYSQWPAYENLSLESIVFSKYVYRWSGPPPSNGSLLRVPRLLASPTEEMGLGSDFVVPYAISGLAGNVSVTYNSASPDQFSVQIVRNSIGTSVPVLIVLDQNFHTEWSAKEVRGGSFADQILVDGALNGFLFVFSISSRELTLTLSFGAQQYFVLGQEVSITVAIALPCAMILVPWFVAFKRAKTKHPPSQR